MTARALTGSVLALVMCAGMAAQAHAAAAPAPVLAHPGAVYLRDEPSGRYVWYSEYVEGTRLLRVVDARGERSSTTVEADRACSGHAEPHVGLMLDICYHTRYASYAVVRLGSGARTPLPHADCGRGFYAGYSAVGRHWLRGTERVGLGEDDFEPLYYNWRTGGCARGAAGLRDIDRARLPRLPDPRCGDGRTRYRVGRDSGDSKRPLVVRLCDERRARRIRCTAPCALRSVGTRAIVWTEGWDVVKAEPIDGRTRYRWRFEDFERTSGYLTIRAADLDGTIYVAVPRRNQTYRLYTIGLPG